MALLQNTNAAWEYAHRREMQEILPGLFLGPYAAASKSQLNNLKAAGITHIICVRSAMEAKFIKLNFPEHFSYYVLDIRDSESQSIIHLFREVNLYIRTILQNGGKVLVHGNTGTCRSACLVLAYVMWHKNMSFQDAPCLVQVQRFCLALTVGFLRQLEEYECILQAEAAVHQSPLDMNRGSVKRKLEEEHQCWENLFPE